uniref:Uncharacterized protein n=1 Tax=Salmo trutta TaxID=8032 RepID=A0A674CN03_SALTR
WGHGQGLQLSTYLCMLWTPPSIWADVVLLSNFRSPEYIMALAPKKVQQAPGPSPKVDLAAGSGHHQYRACSGMDAGRCDPGSCPWHPRRSIHLEPHWWQPGESPSSLERQRGGEVTVR